MPRVPPFDAAKGWIRIEDEDLTRAGACCSSARRPEQRLERSALPWRIVPITGGYQRLGDCASDRGHGGELPVRRHRELDHERVTIERPKLSRREAERL